MYNVHRLISIADNKVKKNPKLKKGKILFDLMSQEYGDITDRLRNTEYDPRRNDARIPKFLGKLKKEINKQAPVV